MTHPHIQCRYCARFNEEEAACEAFPKGIPEEVLYGDFNHTKPYPGDKGILFEPIEEEGG